MKYIFISLLFITCISIALVYGEDDCCRKISKAKAALLEAIDTLQRTNRLLGETGSAIPFNKVAFHARLTPSVTLGSTQTVIFDHVITNIGKAYNQHTGHFTAPFNGIYFFACTFLRPHTATQLHLQMVQNSTEISRGHAATGGGSQEGSMNAVVYMHKGDVVKVRHYPGLGSEIIHGDWSFFTGYRI
ncbi:complement C1q tumor necrosis factor-related protein 3-like [Mytilus trossulus]|uniref:complement C1q tumor necrosis factor-related protein 3-like n=1 Tax=Mytilus trossulus TaxID=6551 RepID=UPI003007006C